MASQTFEAIKLYGWYTALVYLACVPGGIIGDKFLSNRDAVSIGGAFLCIGHLSLAIQNQTFFFVGLILIITGVGLLKPNISTLAWTITVKKMMKEEIRIYYFWYWNKFWGLFLV